MGFPNKPKHRPIPPILTRPNKPLIAFLSLTILGVIYFFYSVRASEYAWGASPFVRVPRSREQVVLQEGGDPTEPFKKRIIAIGDIHGDYPHLTKILREVELIDIKGQWIGGDSVYVQTGDIVDRGKDTIALYRLMDSLRPQAELAGGAVVSLLGNHEFMNAMGDWRYVTKEDIATFGSAKQRRIAMTEGWIGETWRNNYSVTARVPYTIGFNPYTYTGVSSEGDREGEAELTIKEPISSLIYFSEEDLADASNLRQSDQDPFKFSAASFVHGGIIPSYLGGLNAEMPVQKINEIGRGLLEKVVEDAEFVFPANGTDEERNLLSATGPLWDRSYAVDENEPAVCERAKKACEMLGVKRLVMGHTPHFEGIRTRCDGAVLLIDTGLSRAYGGVLSALEIVVTLTPDGQSVKEESSSTTRRWRETETLTAIYVGLKPNKVLTSSERFVELFTEV